MKNIPHLLAACLVFLALAAAMCPPRYAHAAPPTGSFQLAQADTAPAEEGAAESASQPVEELPRMTNKRAAYWGVAVMLATSAIFAGFGLYAIYLSPRSPRNRAKPGGDA
ncbi:MAG: hypothetical protein KF886_06945 [Candidatus Hydrogenedentes bacterium]|nr:hypothetical protein [Candidatus Hydrogenedentota bacterium]